MTFKNAAAADVTQFLQGKYLASKMHFSSKGNFNTKTVHKSGNTIKMKNLKCKRMVICQRKCV